MSYAYHPILLVDDDPGILLAVKQALVAQGYDVTTATNGIEALNAFDDGQPELVLLDLMMPGCDGIEVCRYICEHSSTPIIVVSIRGSEADIIALLDLGADDYLIKPFRMGELLARTRAVLRRIGKLQASKIACGSLEIDTEKRKVTLAGSTVSLTPIEYALLVQLATNIGRVLTTQLLLKRVWGLQYSDSTAYVKVVVRRLRAKLEADPAHPRYIITEPHLGYRLNADP
jgi:two-component system, OmpR family, KDP operon response regulator KdpE